MAPDRIARVNEQLKREISRILRREVKDPRIGSPPTITGVETSADLGHAKVWIRTLAEGAAEADLLEGLRAAASFIRGELGRRLHLRKVPELEFHFDRSLERAQRIEEILSDVLPDSGEEE